MTMGDFFADRLAAQRAEQKAESKRIQAEKKNEQIQRDAGRKYINPERREEATKKFTELRSPSVPAARPSAAPPAVSGKPVEFYAWKEGEMGKIEILAGSDFKPL